MGSLPDSKYIVQTDGYYFVESHDVDPSKGYISVSAKGIINGLSNIPNDGADFGPDTYNPNYTGSGVPYTQTSGIQEAINYTISNKIGKIKLTAEIFNISTPLFAILDKEIIEITGVNMYGQEGAQQPTQGFTQIVNKTSGSTPFIQFGSTLGSVGGSPLVLKNLAFIGNDTSSDGIVTVNLLNYWENVATMSFGSTHGVRIIGAGGQHTLRNVIINNSTSTSGNIVLKIDGIDTVSSYTINNTIIDILGRPDIFLDHVILSGQSTTYASSTYGLYIGDVNAVTGTYCYIGLVDTLITDTNAYTSASHNVFLQIYAEFFSQSVNCNASNAAEQIVIYAYQAPQKAFLTTTITSGVVKIYPSPSQLPTPSLTANPPVSGTAYQNTNPYDIRIYLPAYATTSGTAGTVAIALGSTSSPTAIGTKFISGSTSSSSTEIIELVVPAGWYYEVTLTGTTLATASVFAV